MMGVCGVCLGPCSRDAMTCARHRSHGESPVWRRIVERGGLTSVAAQAGLHRWTVSRIATEGVSRHVGLVTATRLAAALGWGVDELMAAGVAEVAEAPRRTALRAEDALPLLALMRREETSDG